MQGRVRPGPALAGRVRRGPALAGRVWRGAGGGDKERRREAMQPLLPCLARCVCVCARARVCVCACVRTCRRTPGGLCYM